MSSKAFIHEYETPADLYTNLARMFGETESNGTRWVKITVDGVELTFFALNDPQEAEAEAKA